MNRELRNFIKEALEKGHSRDEIKRVLLEAGWQDGEVANGLNSFAEVDFPVAVPRPAPYLYAREAFLYLVSFIALYVFAFSLGALAFGLIDFAFPDSLLRRDNFPSGGEATAIASVIVAFPLYLFLTRWLTRQVEADPERRQSLVRRWLTYLTLVVGAGIILGDLIALLANVLMGDPTVRFALKAVVILVIAGSIFGYYLWDMRRTEAVVSTSGNRWVVRLLLPTVVAAVVACIVYALVLLGTPSYHREVRLDEDRVSNLMNISDNIDLFWDRNEELPRELSQLSGREYHVESLDDPETGARYEYEPLTGSDYRLCAVFATDTADEPHGDRPFWLGAWDHGRGKHCFDLKAHGTGSSE